MTIDEIKRYTDDEELLKKAEGYLKEIEEDGSCEGKYSLALLLQELNNKNLEEEVFDLFKEAAEDGTDADALLQLAILYEVGKGCKKDIVKSSHAATRLSSSEILMRNSSSRRFSGTMRRSWHATGRSTKPIRTIRRR